MKLHAGLLALTAVTVTLFSPAFAADPQPASSKATPSKATPEEARKFINDAERKLLALNVDSARADWIKSTYIIDDTEAIAAKLDERTIAASGYRSLDEGARVSFVVKKGPKGLQAEDVSPA